MTKPRAHLRNTHRSSLLKPPQDPFCPHCGANVRTLPRVAQLVLGAILAIERDSGVDTADERAREYYATQVEIKDRLRGVSYPDTIKDTLATLCQLAFVNVRKAPLRHYNIYRLSAETRAAPGLLEEIALWSTKTLPPSRLNARTIARATWGTSASSPGPPAAPSVRPCAAE